MQTETVPVNKGFESVLSPVIFGTSGLGNLFVALSEEVKLNIVKECIRVSERPVMFDTAGKYGAGLALETLGNCLRELNVKQEDIVISNKLGWVRTELKSEEPTFEPGAWKDLHHDAVQKISYDGIFECFEQGNSLLNGYMPQMVSVHDPDEYMATARDEQHAQTLYKHILDAYRALFDLKRQGRVESVGVGAKDWRIIQRIAGDVELDWAMIANSMTIKNHPKDLLRFIQELDKNGVVVINAAVFHSGFLVGGDYFDYKIVRPGETEDDELFHWRQQFFSVCKDFNIQPAAACMQFAQHVPGVKSIAISATDPAMIEQNISLTKARIPAAFWDALLEKNLVAADFPMDHFKAC